MSGVALWYWRYHGMDYSLWGDEEEAAGIAAAMVDDGGGAPAGIQFPDGRLVPADNWPAFEAAQQRRERREGECLRHEPPPQRKITAPFGGGVISIDAREPGWLGSPVIGAAVPDRKKGRRN